MLGKLGNHEVEHILRTFLNHMGLNLKCSVVKGHNHFDICLSTIMTLENQDLVTMSSLTKALDLQFVTQFYDPIVRSELVALHKFKTNQLTEANNLTYENELLKENNQLLKDKIKLLEQKLEEK